MFIIEAKRTPIGSLNGNLSEIKSPLLGAMAIKGCLDKIKLDPSHIEEVVMGCVYQGGLGQNPSRQASLAAGISVNTPCTTINKVCASGMKAVIYAA